MRKRLGLKIILLLLISAGLIFGAFELFHTRRAKDQPVYVALPDKQAVHPSNIKTLNNKDDGEIWKKVIVQHGDSLAKIFSKLNINPGDLVKVSKKDKELTLLHPGDQIDLLVDSKHHLQKIKYPKNSMETSLLSRKDNHFIKTTIKKPVTTTLAFKSVSIRHSLYRDAKRSGLTNKLTHQLKKIFEGTINFSRDIKPGDHFALLYQEYYVGDKKIKNGNIMAATFTCQNKKHEAIRYTYPISHTGYYTPDGHAVESRFIRKPVKYKRISSHFNRHRFDPVVHRVQPHLGIDFAAYRGTPIKSVGDGKVIFIGKDGGYGKTVIVRYGKHYKALYGHMWHFAKNIKLHSRVHKGQIIGYVGRTGWATGPHLHFGFYKNGRAKDWLKMKMPNGKSIPQSHYSQFLSTSKKLMAQLELYKRTRLAENN